VPRSLTTTSHADSDVNVPEALLAQNEDWFHDLHAETLRLDEVEGNSVALKQSLALVAGDG